MAAGTYRSALRARDLRLLVSAFAVDAIGGWAYGVVLVVYVFDRTGSPTLIAVTTACGWVPRLVFATYAGVLADRYERTRLMAVSGLLCFAVQAVLGGLVLVDGPLVLVFALHALTGAFSTVYRPAAQALVPEVVPESNLAAANALLGVFESLVVVVGPAVGALLLLGGEPAVGVLFNALTYLVATALVRGLRIRSRGGAAEEGGGLLAQVGTGLSALRQEPVALVLVLYVALDSAVFGALSVLLVPLSVEFGTGSEGYGYLLAASALGGVLAAGTVNRLAASGRLAPLIAGGMCVMALPAAVLAAVSSPLLGALLLVVSGVGMVLVDVLGVTALQRDLPREVLSRVFGVLDTLVIGGILLASLLSSAVLAATSLGTTLVVIGVGFSVVSVACLGPLLRADRRNAAALAALRPRIAMLEVLDLFAAAPRSALEQLARGIEVVELPAGSAVLREGDPADALYVVVSGEVQVSARGEGSDVRVLRTLGPRSYLGEIGLLRGGVRTASVDTLEPTVLWRVSGADFLAALETSSPSASVLSVVGSRLARSHPALAAEPFVPPGPSSAEVGAGG